MPTSRQSIAVSVGSGMFVAWHGLPIVIQALVLLTLLDVLSGIGKAFVRKTVSSAVSYRGAVRKSLSFVLIAAGWVAHTKLGISVPLDQIIAGFFCATELFSIVENCQAAGVNLPAGIVKYFYTYQQEQLNGKSKDHGK
jgi:toxin secretion/phage lysis holin